MKNNIKLLSLICVVLVSFAVAGCLGGSGGSSSTYSTPQDVAGINNVVGSFLSAVKQGDVKAATQMSSEHTLSAVHKLIVWDFGADIKDSTDNASTTFYVKSSDIVQPSPEIAYVKALYSSNGNTITIDFSLVKEDGIWIISDIDIQTTSAGDFRIASYLPLAAGNKWKMLENENNSSTSYSYSENILGQGLPVSGKTFYEMSQTSTYQGNLRAESVPFFRSFNNTYLKFAVESDGWWVLLPSLNNGQPFKLLDAAHAFGETRVASVTWNNGSSDYNGEVKIVLGSPELLVTPLKSFSVVAVNIYTTWTEGSSAETNRSTFYLAPGYGIVGVEEYYHNSNTSIEYSERVFSAIIGGVTYENNPVVSTVSPLSNIVVNTPMSPVTLTSTGGTAPYTWQATQKPDWMSVSSAGQVTGSPFSEGPHSFEVRVQDKYGRHSTKTIAVSVVSTQISDTPRPISPPSTDKSIDFPLPERSYTNTAVSVSLDLYPEDKTASYTVVTDTSPQGANFSVGTYPDNPNDDIDGPFFSFYAYTPGTYMFTITATVSTGQRYTIQKSIGISNRGDESENPIYVPGQPY